MLAPLQLQRVWLPFSRAVAICGSVGTSPPPPIGHPRHRRLLLDATRHGSGIETQGQARNQVMQLLEATYQRLHPYNERVHSPSVHSDNTASQTDSMPRPLRVQLVNAPDRPIRLLELCTVHSAANSTPPSSLQRQEVAADPNLGAPGAGMNVLSATVQQRVSLHYCMHCTGANPGQSMIVTRYQLINEVLGATSK